jgi:hypothetical protein
MRRCSFAVLLLAAPGAWSQSVTPQVLAGKNYCHEVELTPTWTVDAGGDQQVLSQFQEGFGKLAYRAAGPDFALASFYVEKYDPRTPMTLSRVYSSKKLILPLKKEGMARPATEEQWNAAPAISGNSGPAFLPLPAVDKEIVRFRGFEFEKTGVHFAFPPFIAAPGGGWIAVLSWNGLLPHGIISFQRARGSMYVDMYRVPASKPAIRVQLDFLDTMPDHILEHAVWFSDRHFVFPINQLKTRLMICDLSPLEPDSHAVLDAAVKITETLGFRCSVDSMVFRLRGSRRKWRCDQLGQAARASARIAIEL